MDIKSLPRFWSKINVHGATQSHVPHLGNCWEWTGARNDRGYGQLRFGKRVLYAHRLMWEHAHGSPPGDVVMHLCDNPGCVRPEHLRAGTLADNARDCFAKGRARGLLTHERVRGEKNHVAKLTRDDVETIRAEPCVRGSGVRLARRFGVSTAVISKVRLRQTWSWL